MTRWLAGITLLVAATGLVQAAGFAPIEPGNRWTYQEAATGEQFTVEVLGTQLFVNQRTYSRLVGYVSAPVWARVDERGDLVYWDEENDLERVLTPFVPVPGAWFEAPLRPCSQQTQPQEGRAILDGAAGSWEVLEVQFRNFDCGFGAHQLEQFAENIGMVRRIVVGPDGPRVFDLIHARVGQQTIEAGQKGQFSVSARRGGPETWLATLRIQLPIGQSIKLLFPSGQEYDARLRDHEGNIVWTWSANKLFTQATHEVTVIGNWEATIEVPIPFRRDDGLNEYVLETWMTSQQVLGAATLVLVPDDRPVLERQVRAMRARQRSK